MSTNDKGRLAFAGWRDADRLQRLNDVIMVFTLPLVYATAFRDFLALPIRLRWLVIGIILVEVAALVFHRKYPVAVLAVVACCEALMVFHLPDTSYLGMFLAVYAAAAWSTGRGRSASLLIIGLSVIWVWSRSWERGDTGIPVLVGVMLVAGLMWFTGLYEASQRGRIETLEQEREVAEQQAAERERAKLARELHDILNHSVTAMVLDARAAGETGTDQEARAALERIATTGRNSLSELRRLLGVLRAGPDGDRPQEIVPPPTVDQLETLIGGLPALGPKVELRREGSVRMADASIELAAYRVVQESLTNVTRHAGAVPTTVRLTYLPDSLEIAVHNVAPEARPARTHPPGMGLVGLHERVALLGGQLHAGPDSDGGFTVGAVLPLRGAG
ncbi:hypothetical protein D5S17_04960 [Pseudonocardiaceae bacterium YIM PH 21723]|nr:hypothetical protein D5S17_04960 [Pseudonocardiaceae bacterium YIM PH 21723]